MNKPRILWTDDEIDLLRPHILFLQSKGYEVVTATNGPDTLELVKNQYFDLVLLDENMPGLSGLEVLTQLKQINGNLPVVMITRIEDEHIMDSAIGSKIADYLIKPVNPNQILLSLKKNLETRKLITRETTSAYRMEFRNLGEEINRASGYGDWEAVYKKLVYWELELERSNDASMYDILGMQKADAGAGFSRFIRNSYLTWIQGKNPAKPLMSPSVFREKILPLTDSGNKVFVVLIDNLRLDQWQVMSSLLGEYYMTESDTLYCSILPTATQYARNALFAGLMPGEIQARYPSLWVSEAEEKPKNNNEEELLRLQLTRLGKKPRLYFDKVTHLKSARKLVDNFSNLLSYDLVVIVYNFIDLLAHANTEVEMIKELAVDDKAYRSLILSWFRHSPLFDFLKLLAAKNVRLVITTDHGSIRVSNPVKIVGDRKTSVNLRYKMGKSLNYNPREVFEIRDPADALLPRSEISTSFIFGMNADFFAYPNNYNQYVNYYRNTYQHGGISMEEMLVPFIIMKPKL